jgi:uncharacterized protein (DUF433 family)
MSGMASLAAPETRQKAEISTNPNIMGGQPCIAGTRVPVDTILVYLNAGESVYDIYEDLVTLPLGSIEAAIEWAQDNGRAVLLPVRRMYDTEPAERRKRIRSLRASC